MQMPIVLTIQEHSSFQGMPIMQAQNIKVRVTDMIHMCQPQVTQELPTVKYANKEIMLKHVQGYTYFKEASSLNSFISAQDFTINFNF